ncbi:MAG: PIN domain-containing protein [Planctomycetota bacterium]|nr:PIN domain-containing protein [Planctomycetota bacterium]
MLIYLDQCCFNRPFDTQEQMRIRQEADAKLYIQARVSAGFVELCWSYMLDFENSHNPYEDRRIAIDKWKYKALKYCPASEAVRVLANEFAGAGIAPKDALHVACARVSGCQYFITTDLKLLKKKECGISIINPIDFIRDTEGKI